MSEYLVLAFNNIGKNTNLLKFSYESKQKAYYYQVHCTTKMYLLVSEGVKFTFFFSFNYIYWHHSKLIDFFCLTVSHFKRVFAIMKCIYIIGTWNKLFFHCYQGNCNILYIYFLPNFNVVHNKNSDIFNSFCTAQLLTPLPPCCIS